MYMKYKPLQMGREDIGNKNYTKYYLGLNKYMEENYV